MRQSKGHHSYEGDFYKWIRNQAFYLKKGEYSKIDIENLVEEIETLGRSERRALESYLLVLLMHMLKTKYQPEARSNSWRLSIKNSRLKIKSRLEESPSLKKYLPEIVDKAYQHARLDAAEETGLDENVFPAQCPWKIEEILED